MRKLLLVPAMLVGAMVIMASTAVASTQVADAPQSAQHSISAAAPTSTQRSTFGQCGHAVHSGSQLIAAWSSMNVLADRDTRSIVSASGWTSMDGSLPDFVSQRGKEFQLARAADVPDYGCGQGNMFPVGTRHYGAGEYVIAIVPAQYAPSQVSGHPCSGCKRLVVMAHSVGRGSCANGFPKYVAVVMYVHVKTIVVKPKPKPKPCGCTTKPKPPVTPPTVNCPAGSQKDSNGGCIAIAISCPTGTQKDSAGNCVAVAVNCPTGTQKDSAGNCVTQTNTAAQACSTKGGSYDNNTGLCTIVQVTGNCSTIIVVNGSGNTVNTTTSGNCNTNPPPLVCTFPNTMVNGTCTPPVVVNPKPGVACYGTPAHLQTGGDGYVFCEVSVPSGATISGVNIAKISGPSDASVNGLVPVSVRWDNTACPANTQCYRAHLWAGQTTGDLAVRFSSSANFATGSSTDNSVDFSVPIKAEVKF